MPGGVTQFVGTLGQGGDDAAAVLLGKPGQRDRAAHRIHRGLGAWDGDPEAAQSRRVLPRFEGPASQPGGCQLGVERLPVGDRVPESGSRASQAATRRPRQDFWPGIIGAVWFGVAIARRLGMVIVAELAEPVVHLGPAVFLRHAGVVLPYLDLHVRPPVESGISAAQLRVICPGTGNATDDGLGGRCAPEAGRTPIAPKRPTVTWPGRCDRPVSDCRPAVSERLVCPGGACRRCACAHLSKGARLTVSGFSVITIPTPNYNRINLR